MPAHSQQTTVHTVSFHLVRTLHLNHQPLTLCTLKIALGKSASGRSSMETWSAFRADSEQMGVF